MTRGEQPGVPDPTVGTLVPDQAAELLAQRAQALARPAQIDDAEDRLELLILTLGGESYGIEARYVHGVFRLRDLAPLPGVPAPTLGMTAWRGELLRVADLRQVLGLPATGLDDRVWVVALGDEQASVGWLAGAVTDLIEVPATEVRPPEGASDLRRAHLRGITSQAILVLDTQSILRV